jgi:hypothetical protein
MTEGDYGDHKPKRHKTIPSGSGLLLNVGSKASVRSACPPIQQRGVPMRVPLSILIAVACFLVIFFWGEPIVGWLTGAR